MARSLRGATSILHGTSLVADDLETPNRRITVAQNLTCVANAMRLPQPPDWYLDWGSGIGECMHGPLTPAMLTAPTLGDGLDAFSSFFGLRIPYMRLSSRDTDQWFEIHLTPLLGVGEILPVLVEIPLLILQRYITLVRGESFDGATIELSYHSSPSVGDLHHWFDCEVRFGAAWNTLRIPAGWLRARNLGFNVAIWETALSECASLIESRQTDPIAYIRAKLLRVFAGNGVLVSVPSLSDMACTLNMSPRTLLRRLRQSGTTYQQEVDAARRKRALVLLSAGNCAITQIAYDLGYSEPAAFTKAFKRWTGLTPAMYRDSQRATIVS
jgi:AraC-like DNA-binding protein